MSGSPETFSADPASCAREPIHIPGGIQPHGVLLVVDEPGLAVTHVSENVAAHLGVGVQDVLGAPLSAVLDADSAREIGTALAQNRWDELNPLRVLAQGKSFDGIVHRHAGTAIVELEPAAQAPAYSAHHALRPALLRIQSSEALLDLYRRTLSAVRDLTGFERVMIYRFGERGHGCVDAEVKEPALESYVGVHYPASDIPQQARDLYTKNWLRIIPDARYVPARIVPEREVSTGAPLDLSFAALRSVSPVHREYLENMGVRASMSVSLVVHGALWGLISCTNHSGPRHVRYELRSACEVLARLASLEIAALEDRHASALRAARRDTEAALAQTMRTAASQDDVLGKILEREAQLLALVKADGAAVVTAHECVTVGAAPPPELVLALTEWLSEHAGDGAFATASLPAEWPPAAPYKDLASGVLTFALPGAVTRRLLWFRREVIGTVTWGGNPHKAVETDRQMRPHPRRSFAAWLEEVRLHSAEWTKADVEAAEELRRYAIEIDLERRVEREQRAVMARDDVLAVVSHDLRNPLSVIDMQTRILLHRDGPAFAEPLVREGALRTQRAVERMSSLIENLLDLAAIEAGSLPLNMQPEDVRAMVEEALDTLRPLAEDKSITLVAQIADVPRVRADRERFYQILSNLIGNAVKFTPSGGRITLQAQTRGDAVVFAVADTGPGIPPEQLPHLFVRYRRGGHAARRQGVGLGLFVVKGIVEAHGGRISVQSEPGHGATFVFSIPRADGANSAA